jgi:hypothetical protein
MLSVFVCGYNTKSNNIKCEINEEREIFNLLKDYDMYTDVIEYKNLPLMQRKLIMLLNKNISEEITSNINKLMNIIKVAQNQIKGIYWY